MYRPSSPKRRAAPNPAPNGVYGAIVASSLTDSAYAAEKDVDAPDGVRLFDGGHPFMSGRLGSPREESHVATQHPAKVANVASGTECGMVAGDDWDGNAQCACDICLGISDVQEGDDEDEQPPAKVAKVAIRTPCGMVAGDDWDGNAQCSCNLCLGIPDSQESDEESEDPSCE